MPATASKVSVAAQIVISEVAIRMTEPLVGPDRQKIHKGCVTAGRLVATNDSRVAAERVLIGSIQDGQQRVEDQRVLENGVSHRRARLRWPSDACQCCACMPRGISSGKFKMDDYLMSIGLLLIWCHSCDNSQYVWNVADGDIGLFLFVAHLARRADWLSDALL